MSLNRPILLPWKRLFKYNKLTRIIPMRVQPPQVKIQTRNLSVSIKLSSNNPTINSINEEYGLYTSGDGSVVEWIASSFPIKTVESTFVWFQDVSGLPWWCSIALCTCILRMVVTTPLTIHQLRNSTKIQSLEKVMEMQVEGPLKQKISKMAKENNWDENTKKFQYISNLNRIRKDTAKLNKVPSIYSTVLVPYVQIPLWISASFALRNLTLSFPFNTTVSDTQLQIYNTLSEGGILWFNNLCVPDPYFILATLSSFGYLFVIQIHAGNQKLRGFRKIFINVIRTFSVLLIPISSYIPSGVVVYWFSSSIYSVIQALLLLSPKIKNKLGLIVPGMRYSSTPYKDLFKRLFPHKKI